MTQPVVHGLCVLVVGVLACVAVLPAPAVAYKTTAGTAPAAVAPEEPFDASFNVNKQLKQPHKKATPGAHPKPESPKVVTAQIKGDGSAQGRVVVTANTVSKLPSKEPAQLWFRGDQPVDPVSHQPVDVKAYSKMDTKIKAKLAALFTSKQKEKKASKASGVKNFKHLLKNREEDEEDENPFGAPPGSAQRALIYNLMARLGSLQAKLTRRADGSRVPGAPVPKAVQVLNAKKIEEVKRELLDRVHLMQSLNSNPLEVELQKQMEAQEIKNLNVPKSQQGFKKNVKVYGAQAQHLAKLLGRKKIMNKLEHAQRTEKKLLQLVKQDRHKLSRAKRTGANLSWIKEQLKVDLHILKQAAASVRKYKALLKPHVRATSRRPGSKRVHKLPKSSSRVSHSKRKKLDHLSKRALMAALKERVRQVEDRVKAKELAHGMTIDGVKKAKKNKKVKKKKKKKTMKSKVKSLTKLVHRAEKRLRRFVKKKHKKESDKRRAEIKRDMLESDRIDIFKNKKKEEKTAEGRKARQLRELKVLNELAKERAEDRRKAAQAKQVPPPKLKRVVDTIKKAIRRGRDVKAVVESLKKHEADIRKDAKRTKKLLKRKSVSLNVAGNSAVGSSGRLGDTEASHAYVLNALEDRVAAMERQLSDLEAGKKAKDKHTKDLKRTLKQNPYHVAEQMAKDDHKHISKHTGQRDRSMSLARLPVAAHGLLKRHSRKSVKPHTDDVQYRVFGKVLGKAHRYFDTVMRKAAGRKA